MVLLLAIGLGLTACGKDKATKAAATAELAPVTVEEAGPFADTLLENLRACDTSALNKAFDLDAIIDAAISGLEAPQSFKDGVAKGARTSFDIASQLCTGTDDGSEHFGILKIREIDGSARVLVRVVSPNGLSYLDMFLGRASPGAPIRIHDFYNFARGVALVGSIRELFEASLDGQNIGSVERTGELVKEAQRLGEQGQPAKALETLDKLPKKFAEQKTVRLLRINYALNLDNESYLREARDYEKRFPDDPAMEFMSLDTHIAKENYKAALISLDKLDAKIGGDPYMDVMRANVYLLDKQPTEAKRHAEKGLAADKTFNDAFWVLVQVSLDTKQFDDTVALFRRALPEFGLSIDPAAVAGDALYAEFASSDAFKVWSEEQPAQ